MWDIHISEKIPLQTKIMEYSHIRRNISLCVCVWSFYQLWYFVRDPHIWENSLHAKRWNIVILVEISLYVSVCMYVKFFNGYGILWDIHISEKIPLHTKREEYKCRNIFACLCVCVCVCVLVFCVCLRVCVWSFYQLWYFCGKTHISEKIPLDTKKRGI